MPRSITSSHSPRSSSTSSTSWKSKTRGYASLDYEPIGYEPADLVRVDVLLHGEPVDAARASSIGRAAQYGRRMVERLRELIPRQLFDVAIQASIGSRIVARETVKAKRKDVPPSATAGTSPASASCSSSRRGARSGCSGWVASTCRRRRSSPRSGWTRRRRRGNDTGVYVHVPFCPTRCGYCDFNAYAGLDHLASRYVSALLREAELAAAGWASDGIASVFVGGGTPTTLEVADLKGSCASTARLRVRARRGGHDRGQPGHGRSPCSRGCSRRGSRACRWGPSRSTHGVLASLERLHDPASVRRAMHEARAAGFANVNLDLIYGADGERIESWDRTLREAVDLAPEHVSAYALTIEPSTPLGRKVQHRSVPPPDPDLQAEMFELACEVLGDAGYQHYEVSNWAKPGFARTTSATGNGVRTWGWVGAHSYRDDRRWWNVRPPEEYLSLVEAGGPGRRRGAPRAEPTPTSRRCSCVCGS